MSTATKKVTKKAPRKVIKVTNGMKGTKGRTVVVKSLSNLAAMALYKFPTPKAARKSMAAGEYAVDETIRIVGTVKIGKDYEQSNIAALPMMKLIMQLGSQISQKRLIEMLSPAALEAISDKDSEDFSKRIQAEWGKLAKTQKKTFVGKVTAKLNFTKA